MKYLAENKAWDLAEDYNVDKLLYLLIDRATIKTDYYIYWKNNRHKYHRDYDLPAVVWINEYVEWWDNGKNQRKNKKDIIFDPNFPIF